MITTNLTLNNLVTLNIVNSTSGRFILPIAKINVSSLEEAVSDFFKIKATKKATYVYFKWIEG